MTKYLSYPPTAHALECQMNNGRPVIACICGLPNRRAEQARSGGEEGSTPTILSTVKLEVNS